VKRVRLNHAGLRGKANVNLHSHPFCVNLFL
jgi:hypothetical protein